MGQGQQWNFLAAVLAVAVAVAAEVSDDAISSTYYPLQSPSTDRLMSFGSVSSLRPPPCLAHTTLCHKQAFIQHPPVPVTLIDKLLLLVQLGSEASHALWGGDGGQGTGVHTGMHNQIQAVVQTTMKSPNMQTIALWLATQSEPHRHNQQRANTTETNTEG